MIDYFITSLINYAEETGLTDPRDRIWAQNALIATLNLDKYSPAVLQESMPLEEILSSISAWAREAGLITDSPAQAERFETRLMGVLTPRPSEITDKFNSLYRTSPQAATDYFYKLCGDTAYIRRWRTALDMRWGYSCEYGEVDLTINLSKPEKDPRDIIAAKSAARGGYPNCLLCAENEGYDGNASDPARRSHRVIPVKLGGEDWFWQYSPYVYYNEHCIAVNRVHCPMKLSRISFVRMLDFVELYPHYFMGSNADLPIVGGSILSHDHMQGGRYSFAMERAPIEGGFAIPGFADISAGIVRWPMSVIRLRGADRGRLTDAATHVFDKWKEYTDEGAFIYARTDRERHNTVTPIARRRGAEFELDLVLRNNITTPEHPLGYFHPHAELHHIKKENIGLIEVMGLAVLPSRLKNEIEQLGEYMAAGKDVATCAELEKHAGWASEIMSRREITAENVKETLREEIGAVFIKVLEQAGVFKRNKSGRAAFGRFIGEL